jgi:5'-phosphate synthase pdxT subunit
LPKTTTRLSNPNLQSLLPSPQSPVPIPHSPATKDTMTSTQPTTVGVLALQGAFAEHVKLFARLGVQAIEIRRPEQLNGLSGLVIPGGESTSMGTIAQRWGLEKPLQAWVASGQPTWGTCAGMILLSQRVVGQKRGGQMLIGGLDVTVNRNYFGRQVDSFEANLSAPLLGEASYPAVFIRAPAIVEMGPHVESLATLPGHENEIVHVAVRQDTILATAFHPELTSDLRWHSLFVEMVGT